MNQQPRIAPGGRSEVGLVNYAIAAVSGRVAGTAPPNLFLTLGRHRALFRGWLRFAGRMMPGGKLARRETELVILRVAHLCDCSYEFDHHVRLGRRAGITEDDVARIVAGPAPDGSWSGWPGRDATLLAAVDAVHVRRDLDDDEWAALRSRCSEREVIELLLLIGHYEMLATFLNVVRVRPDRVVRRARS